MSPNDYRQVVGQTNTTNQRHPLFDAISKELHNDRPILCHINADTSWLVMLPIPPSHRATATRRFFKILIDPWFDGSQIDYGRWFSIQHHVVPSSVQTVEELERVLRDVELEEARICSNDNLSTKNTANETPASDQNSSHHRPSAIDVVMVYHKFTDHCHKDTLMQLPPSVPVIAGFPQAAKLIRSWGHFNESRIHVMPAFGTYVSGQSQAKAEKTSSWNWRFRAGGSQTDSMSSDWRLASCPVLPDWLSMSCLATRVDIPHQGFHSGILIVFNNESKEIAEGIVYAPHGLSDAAAAPLTSGRTDPQIRPLALLYGIVKIDLAGGLIPLNLGGVKGEQIARSLKVSYWIGTHEEDKRAGGGVRYLLSRKKVYTVKDARTDQVTSTKPGEGKLGFDYRELGSGEAFTLV